MLGYFASGLLSRTASRRLARVIPNPFVRAAVVAAAGYAITRFMEKRQTTASRAPRTPRMRTA